MTVAVPAMVSKLSLALMVSPGIELSTSAMAGGFSGRAKTIANGLFSSTFETQGIVPDTRLALPARPVSFRRRLSRPLTCFIGLDRAVPPSSRPEAAWASRRRRRGRLALLRRYQTSAP